MALKIPLSRGQGVQSVSDSPLPRARESDVDGGESFPRHKHVATAGGSDVDVGEAVHQNCCAAADGSDVDGAVGVSVREMTQDGKTCSRPVQQNGG